ncbi:MAG: YciI family protein [Solirubrobacteraceae bacterium]
MNYLLFICSDGVQTPEKTATMRTEVPRWVQEMDRRGVRLMGYELELPSSAVTVRVRGGETIVSDGPFAETKEFVGGFDVIDCADLDKAIEVAASHPVSWFHSIEVRPFAPTQFGEWQIAADGPGGSEVPTEAEIGAPAPGRRRYLLAICVDGIPAGDEVEEGVRRDAEAWVTNAAQRGARVYGHALESADNATTVRVREGETLLSDGPFAETKEFIGGFDILDCADRDEAISLAAAHPLARHHMVEVRPFARG